MTTRGRLIFPFLAGYRLLDVEATNTAGYDDVYRETETIDDGSQLGQDARVESEEVLVPAQVEDSVFSAVQMLATGNAPDFDLTLVHHFADLEQLGLVDDDGTALIKVGDRLAAVYESHGENKKVLDVPTPPGLYVSETRPAGFGLGMSRNLLIVRLQERTTGTPG